MTRMRHRLQISRDDSQYPVLLKEIHDPPSLLWVEGDGSLLSQSRCLAVVGARVCTPYGEKIAFDLSRELAQVGVTIVSGLAHGIDTAAHQGALAGGGKTIAVLGHGIHCRVSNEKKNLWEKIIKNGAIISEFEPTFPGSQWTYPQRNRIISGLSYGVVVVEAGLRSGSLITAHLALQQGREVFAVPGSITSPLSVGTHHLIQNGAKLVTGIKDILDELKFSGLSSPIQRSFFENAEISQDSEDESKILKLLGAGPRQMDELLDSSGCSVEKMSCVLLEMEMNGKIESLAGNRFALKI